MVESASCSQQKKRSNDASSIQYKRVGTGRMAEIADIRDKNKPKGEETKESIIAEHVDQYPRSEEVLAKVSQISEPFNQKESFNCLMNFIDLICPLCQTK